MRRFAFLAVAAAAFSFVAPSHAQAQIVISNGYTPYYGGYSSGYSPYYSSGYSSYRYGNYSSFRSGYRNYNYSPNYYGGYSNGYRGFNSSSYYRGSGYGNYGNYSRGWYGGRRR